MGTFPVRCGGKRARLLGTLAAAAVLLSLQNSAQADQVFSVTNLVTDDQGVNAAQITDPALKNAWGVAGSGTSPFWVGDNGSGVSTLYSVNPLTNATTKLGLTVTIPGDGSVTGVAFNGVGAFGGDNFLFVSEDGTISGWRGALGTMAEILATGSSANVYKGTALDTIGGHSYLLSANFRSGGIDVLKGDAGAPDLAGKFIDPAIPSGYAPFDIKLVGSDIFVTYALQDGTKKDDVAGAGNGFVSKFDMNGNFLGRVASQGALNSPWGLALAPSSFGAFAGDLLVGNFGDGTIDAYDMVTNDFIGQLLTGSGSVLTIDGLWALDVGGGGNEGNSRSIYFTAGPNDESNGLFGVIAPVPEPLTLSLFGAGLAGACLLRRRRKGA
jgi:uncharacterized protein (TIGR03118 family)